VPATTGLRKTYQANGEALAVDMGVIFTSRKAAEEFRDWGYPACELWECKIDRKVSAPVYYFDFVIDLLDGVDPDLCAVIKKNLIKPSGKTYKLLLGKDFTKLLIRHTANNSGIWQHNGQGLKWWDDAETCHAEGIRLVKRIK